MKKSNKAIYSLTVFPIVIMVVIRDIISYVLSLFKETYNVFEEAEKEYDEMIEAYKKHKESNNNI